MITIFERRASGFVPPAAPIPAIDNFDYDAAHWEGWTLSNLGRYRDRTLHVELQRLDRRKTADGGFSIDRDAWAHAVKRAREGSPLHLAALSLIDRRERLAITADCGTW